MSWRHVVTASVVLLFAIGSTLLKRRRQTRERIEALRPDLPIRPPLGDYRGE